MKAITQLMLLAIFAPQYGSCQEPVKLDVLRNAPKLVAGATVSLTNTATSYTYVGPTYTDMAAAGATAFAKYSLGNRFALQTTFGYRRSEKEYGGGYTIYPYMPPQYSDSRSSTFFTYWDINLQAQYYLLAASSKLRPYFFAGPGICNYNFHISNTFFRSGLVVANENFQVKDNSLCTILGQGLIYQLNYRLQFVESLSYQYELSYGRNTIGLNIGLGYKLL